MMVPWCSMDTKAARGSVDPDMAAGQAHLPMPIVHFNFGGSWSRRYYNNQRNS